ncbi:16S rRNA methyltransferase [Psychromonas sp. PRT-SC03]|nr:16S rRNA methyltransferase [Psychromonas sp. PRT-SC03]
MPVMQQKHANPSQLLQRNESIFENKKILVAGNITDEYPLVLQTLAQSSTFCFSDYRYYRQIKEKLTSSKVYFTDNYQGDEVFDLLLIYLPKAKQETLYLLASLSVHLQQGASIILVGEKKCGIKSANTLLKSYASTINSIDSARHCALLYAELNKTVQPFTQQDWIKTYPLTINGTHLDICSLPGVFSYGALDPGSALLLQNLPQKISGNILDFGCGAGVLACYLLTKYKDINMDLIDINVYALASAKLSLLKNNLKGDIFPSDVFSEVDKKYNLLISNPPFHSGKETDYQAAETFINQSVEYLATRGKLRIVANKFLRYEPLLEGVLKQADAVQENNKFKVLSYMKK